MDSRGTQTYGYDPANQLNDATLGGATTSYIYNGDGVRTARETSSSYTEYVIDHNRSLPVILYDETAFYVWGLDLIARIVGSTQQYYHYDGLGSTRALTGNTGTTLATYNYDVFGTIRSQTGSQTNNFLFTGEWRDPETGFYFLRARYYDTVVGRFINRDPWPGDSLDPPSLNAYAYVTNNPTTRVDPSGLADTAREFAFEKRQYAYSRIQDILRRCKEKFDACIIKVTQNDLKALADWVKRLFRGGEGTTSVKPTSITIKTEHGSRHLEGTGLTAAEVEAAISAHAQQSIAGASSVGPFSGRVNVGGQVIEYRAFPIDGGSTINVGTYYPVSGP